MTDKSTVADTMAEWRKFFFVSLASHDNFLNNSDIEGVDIDNTDDNRTIFGLLPDEHRRHDIQYTLDSLGRHISTSQMTITPAAKTLIDSAAPDLMKAISDADDGAGFIAPSTIQVAKVSAEEIYKYFDESAAESIKKTRQLMDEVDEAEQRLAARGESYDQKSQKKK